LLSKNLLSKNNIHPTLVERLSNSLRFFWVEKGEAVQKRASTKAYIRPELTFAGQVVRCGHCGHWVTGERKFKRCADGVTRAYTYYFCTKYQTKGHPRIRWTEAQMEGHFLAVFARMRISDPEAMAWIVEVIKARANASQAQNTQHRADLERQKSQVEDKLKALLDLRMDKEISPEEYATKRAELHERQSGIRLQLEVTDHDDEEVAKTAIRVLELAQPRKPLGKCRLRLQADDPGHRL
jgi:site-specific DNA recombinase